MKKAKPAWYYDEFKHPGVDYADPEMVRQYDVSHQKFRNYEKEGEAVVQALGLDAKSRVIDMGCGTGAFTCYAAKVCRKVYAVDISPAMLAFCKEKAGVAGLKNIEFHHGGFLSYEHRGQPVDAVVSTAVLHHLPDFWKLVGLKRVYEMLKPSGRFYLGDVTYSINVGCYEEALNDMVEKAARQIGPALSKETATTIRDEHGTLSWIMEGLIRQAGFRIDSVRYQGIFGAYICSKEKPGIKT